MHTPRRLGAVLATSVLTALCALGCQGSSGSGSGAVCIAQEQTLAPVDPNSASVYLRGGYVYIGSRSGKSSLTRVPLLGGPTETIAETDVVRYGANDANTVAWLSHSSSPTLFGATLKWLGPGQASGSGVLPAGLLGVVEIAVDRANNIFLMTNDEQGGNSVWRYSAQHQTFDMLHHNVAGLTGFYEDADGIAWIGPIKGGSALFHEAVTGGAPTVGPALSDATPGNYIGYANVVGLDASTLYVTSGSRISGFDRATGQSSTKIDLIADSSPGPTSVEVNSITMDDTSFYWIERDHTGGTATIRRVAKSGTGSIDTVATVNNIQSLSVGGCSLVYVGGPDSSSWGIVARPK